MSRRELTTEYLLPKKIIKEQECENTNWLLNSDADQVYIVNTGRCIIKNNGYVILDFGKELHGGIRIITESCGDNLGKQNVRIRFGESVGEACAELGGKDNATNDHSPRDMMVCLPLFSDLTFGQTGFRFIRIDNLSGGNLVLISTQAAYTHLKELPKGYFKCDDTLVNEIYDTAAHTLFLCMQNRLWDGIKRDRLVWLGDMHPEFRGVLSLYGEHPLIESGLCEATLHNVLPAWMSEVPSYSIWWLAILCEYEWYTGKWEFVKSQLDYAYGVISQINVCVSDDGVLDYTKAGLPTAYGFFLNWETSKEQGLESGNRGLLLATMQKFVSMAKRRGVDYKLAEIIINKLNKNKLFNGCSKPVAALYSMGYGYNDNVKDILTNGGAKGFSTFMSYYISKSLVGCDNADIALRDLKEFYGGMLSRGATSFWESYDPDWLVHSGRIDEFTPSGKKDIHSSFGAFCYVGYRLSLCHGWACGPVPFLSENALGIKFLDVGGKKVKIEPNLMGLNKVEGAYPTPFGLIEVSHKQTDSGVVSKVKLPSGVIQV